MTTFRPVYSISFRPLLRRGGEKTSFVFSVLPPYSPTVVSTEVRADMNPTGVSSFNCFSAPFGRPDAKAAITVVPTPTVHGRRADKKIRRVVRAPFAAGDSVVNFHPDHLLGGQSPVFLGDDTVVTGFYFNEGQVFFQESVASPKVLPFAQGEFLCVKFRFSGGGEAAQ